MIDVLEFSIYVGFWWVKYINHCMACGSRGPWKPRCRQMDVMEPQRCGLPNSNLLAAACWFSSRLIFTVYNYIYICLYWEKYHLISIYPDEHYIYIPMYIHLCVYVYTVLRSSHSYPTKIWSHIDLIPKRWWLYRGVFCQCFRFKILSQVILFRLVQAYLPNLVDFFFRSEHCCLPRGVRIFYPKRFDVLRC